MKDWPTLPEDDDLERADALLDQADALLRRHRAPAFPPPAQPAPASAAPGPEIHPQPPALEDDDDLPILTDIVEDFELAGLGASAASEPAEAPPPAAAPTDPASIAGTSANYAAAAPEDEFAPPPAIAEPSAAETAAAAAEPAEALPAGNAPPAAPPPAGPAIPAMAAFQPATASISAPADTAPPPTALPPSPAARWTAADEDALLVSARAALIEELVELDTEIARAVEAWLADELPQIVAREMDSLAERIRVETLAQLRATLLPALSGRIAHRIDKLVD